MISELYQKLPTEVREAAQTLQLELNAPNVNQLFKSHLPKLDFESSLQYHTYLLDETGSKSLKKKYFKKRKDALTAKQRKKLFDISKANLKYETFVKVNLVWQEYIAKIINEVKSPADHLKLARADYHGGYFVVVASRNPSLVGIKGFVVQETKHTFRIITKEDKISSNNHDIFTILLNYFICLAIPKIGSKFAFKSQGKFFTLNGNHLKMTSYNRSRMRSKAKSYTKEI